VGLDRMNVGVLAELVISSSVKAGSRSAISGSSISLPLKLSPCDVSECGYLPLIVASASLW
jgi:hypothetical protein